MDGHKNREKKEKERTVRCHQTKSKGRESGKIKGGKSKYCMDCMEYHYVARKSTEPNAKLHKSSKENPLLEIAESTSGEFLLICFLKNGFLENSEISFFR